MVMWMGTVTSGSICCRLTLGNAFSSNSKIRFQDLIVDRCAAHRCTRDKIRPSALSKKAG